MTTSNRIARIRAQETRLSSILAEILATDNLETAEDALVLSALIDFAHLALTREVRQFANELHKGTEQITPAEYVEGARAFYSLHGYALRPEDEALLERFASVNSQTIRRTASEWRDLLAAA